MYEMHLETNSSTSIPAVESPSASWAVFLCERSAALTRRRESMVASEVCLTFSKSSFALRTVW